MVKNNWISVNGATLGVSREGELIGSMNGVDGIKLGKTENREMFLAILRKMLGIQKARWILHDVCCEESYECSHCHKWFVEEKYPGCDKWANCPCCGEEMEVRG